MAEDGGRHPVIEYVLALVVAVRRTQQEARRGMRFSTKTVTPSEAEPISPRYSKCTRTGGASGTPSIIWRMVRQMTADVEERFCLTKTVTPSEAEEHRHDIPNAPEREARRARRQLSGEW